MSQKIEKLSPEKEALLPKYRQKWLEIGLQQGKPLPSDERLIELLSAVYKEAGISQVPTVIHRATSPRDATRIYNELRRKEDPNAGDQVPDFLYGAHEAGWLAFYNFFLIEFPEVKGPERLLPLMNLAAAAVGWVVPLEGQAIVTPVPAEVHMRNGVLHNSNGPAITYADGFSVYALNGVMFRGEMTKYISTPTDQLDYAEVLSIRNVEQRAEVIKRIGISNLFTRLSPKLLDSSREHGYELYSITLGNYEPRKYLKMLNPSVEGEIHIEAVHPDCKIVNEALSFRNFGTVSNDFTKPMVLT